jgi:hypothetical protein
MGFVMTFHESLFGGGSDRSSFKNFPFPEIEVRNYNSNYRGNYAYKRNLIPHNPSPILSALKGHKRTGQANPAVLD